MCPHCNADDHSILTGHSFSQGSVAKQYFRCALCKAEWELNRAFIVTMTKRGWTPTEQRQAIQEIAALQVMANTLDRHNAPAEWSHYIRPSVPTS